MGYEIDFLSVGDGSRGGDAIAMRYGDLHGDRSKQTIIIIDGGTKDSGKKLVEHINKYYKTNIVDLVVSTHLHADHASGLTVVLEEMDVHEIWMHKPGDHAEDMKKLFEKGSFTGSGLRMTLEKSLSNVYDLQKIAEEKKILINEPFSDDADSSRVLAVLSPSKSFYELMLANFQKTPEPKANASLIEKATAKVSEAINWIAEHWGKETLADPEENETSPENNSSVILLFQYDDRKFLFTGDAGVEAINKAIVKLENLGIGVETIERLQIPHHGSRHNVGPTILNAIIGPKLDEEKHLKTAYISAPSKGDPKHPSRKVINALKRRGAFVYSTQGSSLHHFTSDAPERKDWGKAKPLDFCNEVEE